MISWIFATILSFCPVTSATNITGYHCYAYALSEAFTGPVACPPGLCEAGIAEGELNHSFRILGCTVDPGPLTIGPEAPGEFVIFSVEPEYDPNHMVCSPGGCADVWWIPSLDPNAPCVCPNGEC